MVKSRPSYPVTRLDYSLPPELIAQQPLAERSASRMLHVQAGGADTEVGQASSLPEQNHRQDACATSTGRITDRMFAELPELLPAGCLIVLNDSRVIPARLYGERAVSPLGQGGGRVEVLFHRWLGEGVCEAVVGSGASQPAGEKVLLPAGWRCELLDPKCADSTRVRYLTPRGRPAELAELLGYLERYGLPPLPPYIKRGGLAPVLQAPVAADSRGARGEISRGGRPQRLPATQDDPQAATPAATRDIPVTPDADRQRYQTVYAQQPGSVAAPTAGLHFDEAMLARLRADGHEFAQVTLHVGLGTFAPLRVTDLRDHEMHEEAYSVTPRACEAYLRARETGRPVLAVGTTSLRVLHTLLGRAAVPGRLTGGQPSLAAERAAGRDARAPEALTGLTRAFIYPGQGTQACDLLLTNFHLPRSTLLALLYSFGGEELLKRAYAHAIAQRYRFFSYGDCMLIDRRLSGLW